MGNSKLVEILEEKTKLKFKMESQLYYGMKLEQEIVDRYNFLIDLIRNEGVN